VLVVSVSVLVSGVSRCCTHHSTHHSHSHPSILRILRQLSKLPRWSYSRSRRLQPLLSLSGAQSTAPLPAASTSSAVTPTTTTSSARAPCSADTARPTLSHSLTRSHTPSRAPLTPQGCEQAQVQHGVSTARRVVVLLGGHRGRGREARADAQDQERHVRPAVEGLAPDAARRLAGALPSLRARPHEPMYAYLPACTPVSLCCWQLCREHLAAAAATMLRCCDVRRG